MIDFYTNPRSRGLIVNWMLEEVGAPYKTHVLEYDTTMKAPEFLAINPMGKVPALVHDGQIVTETAAICTYLAETFPEAGLAPTPAERGAYLRWMFFGAGPLEAAVTNTAMGFAVPEGKTRMSGYGQFDDVVGALEAWLGQNTYFAGARFTAVDVYTGGQIGWGLTFGTLPDRPAFRRYWERIKDRPARGRVEGL